MKKIKRFFNYLKYFLLSKYFLGIVLLVFFIFAGFQGKYSKRERCKLEKENLVLKKDTAENNRVITDLKSKIKALDSLAFIEKYAREHYRMQAENENVFLFEKWFAKKNISKNILSIKKNVLPLHPHSQIGTWSSNVRINRVSRLPN